MTIERNVHQIIESKFMKMITRMFLYVTRLAAKLNYGHIRHVLIVQ